MQFECVWALCTCVARKRPLWQVAPVELDGCLCRQQRTRFPPPRNALCASSTKGNAPRHMTRAMHSHWFTIGSVSVCLVPFDPSRGREYIFCGGVEIHNYLEKSGNRCWREFWRPRLFWSDAWAPAALELKSTSDRDCEPRIHLLT